MLTATVRHNISIGILFVVLVSLPLFHLDCTCSVNTFGIPNECKTIEKPVRFKLFATFLLNFPIFPQ